MGTKIDPTLCRAARLVGHVLGLKGTLPSIYTELEVNYFTLRRLLGVKTEDGKQAKISKLTKNEVIMVNIGSTATGAKVIAAKIDVAKLVLTSPAWSSTLDDCNALRKHGKRPEAKACFQTLTKSPDPYLRAEGFWGFAAGDSGCVPQKLRSFFAHQR